MARYYTKVARVHGLAMEYSLPYLIYFAFLLLLHGVYCTAKKREANLKKTRRNLDILVVFSFMIFFGLRGFIYTDCFQYYDFFRKSYVYELSYLNGWYEPGYILCNQFIGLFTHNFWVYQFIWTGIDLLLLFAILRRECGEKFYLAIAFLIPLWTGNEMNLFRNAKAILIFFWALPYIRDQKIVKYLISIFVASTFHITALFFLPMYFFVNKRLLKLFVVFGVIAIVFYFIGLSDVTSHFLSFGKMIGGRMDIKSVAYTTDVAANIFSFGTLYRLFLLSVAIYTYKRYSKINIEVINISLIYCCVFLALSSILVLRDRFASMFVLGLICWLPNAFECFHSKSAAKMLTFVNILFLFAYTFVQTNNPAAQYENLLTGISTYSQAFSRVFSVVGH